MRGWLAEVGTRLAAGPAPAGSGSGSALMPDSPFNTPWRQAKGGLWDLGPHLVALLWKALGPVESVTADAGAGDVTHLVLHHRGGQSSVLTVAMDSFQQRLRISALSPRSHFVHEQLPRPTRAPTAGQHTEEVLQSILGYDDARLAAARSRRLHPRTTGHEGDRWSRGN